MCSRKPYLKSENQVEKYVKTLLWFDYIEIRVLVDSSSKKHEEFNKKCPRSQYCMRNSINRFAWHHRSSQKPYLKLSPSKIPFPIISTPSIVLSLLSFIAKQCCITVKSQIAYWLLWFQSQKIGCKTLNTFFSKLDFWKL